ncbi:MAG: SPOR domain-containing protein [Desulfuromonadales bacterium]
MNFKFSKDSGNKLKKDGENTDQRARVKWIVAAVIIVVAIICIVFAVLGPKEVPAPVAAPKIIKMPLPPNGDDAGKAESKPVEARKEAVAPPKPEPPKVAQAAPVAAAVPAAKPPAQPPVKPNEEPKKTEPPKTKEEPKKVEPAKPADAKPVVAGKKPAVADNKPVPVKTDVKKADAVTAPKPKAPPEKSEKPLKTKPESADSGKAWSILIGTYVLEDALSADMGRVRKAGFNPVVTSGTRKKSVMNRLLFSEYDDRVAAGIALDQLKRLTSDAFIIDHAGKYTVCAGSYLQDTFAASEKERLKSAGFPVSLKRVEVAIPSQSLTLGPFNDKKAADAALGKLKAAGVKAALSRR